MITELLKMGTLWQCAAKICIGVDGISGVSSNYLCMNILRSPICKTMEVIDMLPRVRLSPCTQDSKLQYSEGSKFPECDVRSGNLRYSYVRNE